MYSNLTFSNWKKQNLKVLRYWKRPHYKTFLIQQQLFKFKVINATSFNSHSFLNATHMGKSSVSESNLLISKIESLQKESLLTLGSF